MPIASAVVVPVDENRRKALEHTLASKEGVSVVGSSPKGVAITLEADSVEQLERISEEIQSYEGVLQVFLVYLNWEDTVVENTKESI